MRVYIEFERVLDHLALIDEEARKCSQLTELLALAAEEVSSDNIDLQRQIDKVLRDAEKLQRNAFRRRTLLLEIVTILKRANVNAGITIDEIGDRINGLSNGGQYE